LFDAAAAAACGVDGGAAQCELCLETVCCADFKECLDDPTCQRAFSTYRACILKPGQMDQPGCLSAFSRTIHTGDSGHMGLINCLFGLSTSGAPGSSGCELCGGASVL